MTQPIFVRLSKAQDILGVHRSTIYRWAQRGLIDIHKRGQVSLIRVEDFERVVAEQ